MRLLNVVLTLALVFQLFIPANSEVIAAPNAESTFSVVDYTIVEQDNTIEAKWLIEGEEEYPLNFSIIVNGVTSDMVHERTFIEIYDDSKWLYTYRFPKEESVQDYEVVINNERVGMEEIRLQHQIGEETRDILLPGEEIVEIPETQNYVEYISSYAIGFGMVIFLNSVHEDVKEVQFFHNGTPFEAKFIDNGDSPVRQYELEELEPGTEYELSIHLLNENGELLQEVPHVFETESLPPEEELVDIQDNNLLEAIQNRLGIYHRGITYEELESVSGLHITKNVSDLSPLKYATNLRFITFTDLNIDSKSFDVLQEIESLNTLTFTHVELNDWSFLKSLTQLFSLNLQNTNLNDLGVLPSGLSELFLFYNPATNYEELLSMPIYFAFIIQPNLDEFLTTELKTQLENKGIALETSDPLTATNPFGVSVEVTNQSPDSLSISWDNSAENVTYININNQKYINTTGNSYTFNQLDPDKEYFIELFVTDEYDRLGQYGYAQTNTLPGNGQESTDGEAKKSVVSKPKVENGIAVVPTSDIEAVENGDTLVLEFTEEEAVVTFTKEQVATLKEKDASLKVKNSKVELNIPLSNLPDGKEISADVKKLDPIQDAVSDVYDFTIYADGEPVHQFGEPITLVFNIDESKVNNTDNLKVFYYNETKKVWELVPGAVYHDGNVIVQTDHFSIFTVFEKIDNEVTAEEPKKDSTQSPSDNNTDPSGSFGETETGVEVEVELEVETVSSDDQSQSDNVTTKKEKIDSPEKETSDKEGNELPNTATSLYNMLLLGVFLLLAGGIYVTLQRRKNA
ncbi:LPXTG-motif cell wall anchor domain-containing protein [Mesobacillus persicus]|uniref:LPXTG-motif cell wall anchor domain-containing protein n=1 Tax=Mesobacillus persicus TaxID=930146 RepID=A0A1H8K681_9BACI|nr:LPXTG cell wall anchor domain-containing protein [Mesobacillus persicus]SEN88520.1 LPXTG-motif cell wall anchor domain-containing protein [Mesobacillus persicus]